MMILRRAARALVVWTATVGAAAALTAAPTAAATPSRAMVPDGVYGITLGGDENARLTFLSAQEGSPTVLLPQIGLPGHQEWQLVRDSRTSQLIRNINSGLYLTLGGRPPQNHRKIVASPYPFSWSVRTGSTPDRVTISATMDGVFRLDKSPLPIYPPRVDLQDPRDDLSQEWQLTLHE